MTDLRPLDLAATRRAVVIATVLLAAAVGVGIGIDVEQGPITLADGAQRSEPVPVRHSDAGQLARWSARLGTVVKAGDVIGTLETRSLDGVIDALKKQIGAVRARADAIRQEAHALAGVEGASTSRAAALDGQVADLDKEEVGLKVRLSMYEQDRTRTAVKAPVAGRIAELAVAEGAHFKAGTTLAVIVPEAGRLRLEATWSPGLVPITVRRPVRAWLHDAVLPVTVFSGHIETMEEPDASGRVRTRIVVDVSGTPLADPQPREHQLRFVVQHLTERRPLALHVIAPLWRPSQIVNASSR